MANRLESSIERSVCEYAKKLGCLVLKCNPAMSNGLPDRQFLFSGRVFFIEFKAPGKKPTPLQSLRHEELASRGFDVYVVDDVTFGKALITNFVEQRQW